MLPHHTHPCVVLAALTGGAGPSISTCSVPTPPLREEFGEGRDDRHYVSQRASSPEHSLLGQGTCTVPQLRASRGSGFGWRSSWEAFSTCVLIPDPELKGNGYILLSSRKPRGPRPSRITSRDPARNEKHEGGERRWRAYGIEGILGLKRWGIANRLSLPSELSGLRASFLPSQLQAHSASLILKEQQLLHPVPMPPFIVFQPF